MNLQTELQRAALHLQRAENQACRQICSRLLQQNPQLPAAFNLRGLALAQEKNYSAAIEDLGKVWPAQPLNYQAALWLGRCLRLTGNFQQALEPLKAAACNDSLEPEARYELAQCLTRLRETRQAIEHYEAILRLQPHHAHAAANLAFLLERSNRLTEAETMVKRALGLHPENFMARLTWGTLLRREGNYAQAEQQFERCLSQPLSVMNHSIVLNQLGQSLLARQEYLQAFRSFEQANSLLREQHPLGAPDHHGSYGLATIARLRDWLSLHPPASWSAPLPGSEEPAPVFMVGFPRSGTTLMDQALSAHPEIEVLEEFELLDEVRRDWVDDDNLDKLPAMTEAELRRARQTYLDGLEERRKFPGKPQVIDKLPLNLVYLFLVNRLFPRARILFMLRDPRDACLSCFFQLFDLQGAMPYFLDLRQTAVYYDAVMGLARQSLKQIDNPVKTLRYEELVVNFEASMREVLQFLDIPWSEEINQYRSKAAEKVIDTPSYQQVTRPLYLEAMGRWRHFADFLEPSQALLGPWVQHFEYPQH